MASSHRSGDGSYLSLSQQRSRYLEEKTSELECSSPSHPHLHPGPQPSNDCERLAMCAQAPGVGVGSTPAGRGRRSRCAMHSVKAPERQWPLVLPTAGLQVGGQLVKRPAGGQAHHPLGGGRAGWGPAPVTGLHYIPPVPLTPGKPPMLPAMRVQGDVTVAVETQGRPLFIYFCPPQNSPCLSFRLLLLNGGQWEGRLEGGGARLGWGPRNRSHHPEDPGTFS